MFLTNYYNITTCRYNYVYVQNQMSNYKIDRFHIIFEPSFLYQWEALEGEIVQISFLVFT